MNKWHNDLSKYKPSIADIFLTTRKTGVGPAEAELDETEAKISNIKKEGTIEGIESGIDFSLESTSVADETDQMVMSPVPPEEIAEKQVFQTFPKGSEYPTPTSPAASNAPHFPPLSLCIYIITPWTKVLVHYQMSMY